MKKLYIALELEKYIKPIVVFIFTALQAPKPKVPKGNPPQFTQKLMPLVIIMYLIYCS
jgi:hypothetical protein